MNREKVAGENFRDGSMEVAFEPWVEIKELCSSYVDSNGDSHRYQGKRYRNESELDSFCSRIVQSAELILKLGGTADMFRPKRLLRAIFCLCCKK